MPFFVISTENLLSPAPTSYWPLPASPQSAAKSPLAPGVPPRNPNSGLKRSASTARVPAARRFRKKSILCKRISIVFSRIPSFLRSLTASLVVLADWIFNRSCLSAPAVRAQESRVSILASPSRECVFMIPFPSFTSFPSSPANRSPEKSSSPARSMVSPIKLLHMTKEPETVASVFPVLPGKSAVSRYPYCPALPAHICARLPPAP